MKKQILFLLVFLLLSCTRNWPWGNRIKYVQEDIPVRKIIFLKEKEESEIHLPLTENIPIFYTDEFLEKFHKDPETMRENLYVLQEKKKFVIVKGKVADKRLRAIDASPDMVSPGYFFTHTSYPRQIIALFPSGNIKSDYVLHKIGDEVSLICAVSLPLNEKAVFFHSCVIWH